MIVIVVSMIGSSLLDKILAVLIKSMRGVLVINLLLITLDPSPQEHMDDNVVSRITCSILFYMW